MALTLHRSGSSPAISLAGALVRGPDGTPKHLHLSVPYVPLAARGARKRLQVAIERQIAENPDVPYTLHRMTKSGGVTNKRSWISWL
jgi:hypothetical protein